MRSAFLRRFQNFFSYTSQWKRGKRFGENPAAFLLLLSTADEKCVWEKIGKQIVCSSLHYRGIENRFGEEIIYFYEISAALAYMGEMSPPTTHWRWEAGLNSESENFSSHFPMDMRSAFWKKNRNLFEKVSVPIFHWRRDAQVVRFSGIFSSSLKCEKCQPPLFHYPLEEKRLFERKKRTAIQIFFSLIYLDRKRSNGRKNLKTEKTALSQKRLCDRAVWCWKIHDCVI